MAEKAKTHKSEPQPAGTTSPETQTIKPEDVGTMASAFGDAANPESAGVVEPTDIPSFLQEDMSEVDTSMPVLKAGQLIDWKCTELKIEPNKAGDGQNLRAKLVTVAAGAEQTDGKVAGEGFPYFFTCSLTPTEKYDEDQIKKNVARFVQGFGKSHLFPLTQYIGAVCTAKTKIKPERKNKDTGEVYAESTELVFVPPGE